MPEGTLHVQGKDDPVPPPRHDLVDDQLLEEIELLVDVITRVAGHAGYLSRDEVDSVLGLPGVAHGAFYGPEDTMASIRRSRADRANLLKPEEAVTAVR
jgi:hypothetical protein